MKFNELGCFFLSKVNNITESLEKSLDKVVSRGEKNFSVHNQYMNFLRPRKTALDEPLYKFSAGRSMVEMLGVLAIIGVLSVGAIAGYSKAMMKYKLNKHAEAFNMLLNNALQIKDKLEYNYDNENGYTEYGDIFSKLGLIPSGFTYVNNTYMTDTFNDKVYIYSVTKPSSHNIPFGAIRTHFQPTSEGADICRNVVTVAKENAANLWYVTVYKNVFTDDQVDEQGSIYGDAYCGDDKKCLHNLNIDDIDALCNICDQDECAVYTLWQL